MPFTRRLPSLVPAARHRRTWLLVKVALVLLAIWATPAMASSADRCLAVADLQQRDNQRPQLGRFEFEPPGLRRLLQPASLKKSEVRLTFVGHSTFLIESAGGIKIATDFNDYVKPAVLPDIVTMNRAHNSHYTDNPDPAIRHVLKGWGTSTGSAVTHDLELADVRVRNVVTNIRDYGGGTQLFANSIFIFEMGGLCIAHLGHLHHTLTPKHLEQIGMMDIVLVPVDGSYTLDLPGMVEVVKALRARLIIPMHYFSIYGLNRFLEQVGGEFPVKHATAPMHVASKANLPPQPEILVLPGN